MLKERLIDFKIKSLLLKGILFSKFKIFFGGDILITTNCSTNCRFCIYSNLKKEEMSLDIIKKVISFYKKIGLRNLRISGGEPFQTYGKLLFTLNESFKYYNKDKVSLITSLNWASTRKITKQLFKPLIQMGLRKIIISIDAFHLEKINIKNYIND